MLQRIVLVLLCAVVFCSGIYADTLFKDRKPIAIGHGKVEGANIAWQSCDGNGSKTYKKPPYWLDKADNCNVDATSFGLVSSGEDYVVENEKETRKYLPNVQNGDRVTLTKSADFVTLSNSGKTVTLTRRLPTKSSATSASGHSTTPR